MIRALARPLDTVMAWYLRRTLFNQRSHCTLADQLTPLLEEFEPARRAIYREPPPLNESEVEVFQADPLWGADHVVFRMPSTRPSLPPNDFIWGHAVLPRGHGFAAPLAFLVHPWIGPTGRRWLGKFGKPLLRHGVGCVSIELPHHAHRARDDHWSGELAFCGNLASVAEAGIQAVGDMRRVLAWLRSRGATRLGAMGYSLGGWGAAMLAPGEPDLEFIAAGAPVADAAAALRESVLSHGPILEDVKLSNLSDEAVARFGALISPLSYPATLPPERLLVIAPIHDAVIPPESFERLAAHWRCDIWREPHSHVSLFISPGFRRRITRWMAERLS